MKTTPLKKTNEKQTIIHTYEEDEPCFPFGILEEIEVVDEEGNMTHTYEPILGNNKLGQTLYKTKEEAEKYIKSKPYQLILALMCHVIEMKESFDKEQKQLKEIRNENEK